MKNTLSKLTVSLVLAMAFTFSLTACGLRDIKDNTYYDVKAKDGSGKVLLYNDEALKTSKLIVPDGEIVKVIKMYGNIWSETGYVYKSEYKGNTYYVREDDINEIAGASKAKDIEFRDRKTREGIEFFSWLAAILVIYFFLYKWNKTLSLRVYRKYYAKKRQEFPWLDDFIQKNGDPSVSRAQDHSGVSVVIALIILLVLIFITYFIGKSSVEINLIYVAISVGICLLIGIKTSKGAGYEEPEAGLTLECPHCHCPHSWGMTRDEVIIENKTTHTEETKTTYSNGDVYYHTKITYTYDGREFKDFICLNCGSTEHGEYDRVWTRAEKEAAPEPELHNYNPPKMAYNYVDPILAKAQAKAAKANRPRKTVKDLIVLIFSGIAGLITGIFSLLFGLLGFIGAGIMPVIISIAVAIGVFGTAYYVSAELDLDFYINVAIYIIVPLAGLITTYTACKKRKYILFIIMLALGIPGYIGLVSEIQGDPIFVPSRTVEFLSKNTYMEYGIQKTAVAKNQWNNQNKTGTPMYKSDSKKDQIKLLKKGDILTVIGKPLGNFLPVEHQGTIGYIEMDYIGLPEKPAPIIPAPKTGGKK